MDKKTTPSPTASLSIVGASAASRSASMLTEVSPDDVEAASPVRASSSSTASPNILLLFVATALSVATYIEDAMRCITMWSSQLKFLARHLGLPSAAAGGLLLTVAAIQLASPIMMVPTSYVPWVAKVVMVECGLIAVSVVMQPFLFNQLSNFELLSLSLAQLGATGLVFAEAHFVAFPRKNPFASHLSRSSAQVREAKACVSGVHLVRRA